MNSMSTELANIDQNLLHKGRPINFAKFALAVGADLANKKEKKDARLAYGKLQAEFRKHAGTALGAAVSSGQYEAVKLEVGTYADGRRKITAVLAEPKNKDTAAAKLNAASAEIAALKAQIAALKAK